MGLLEGFKSQKKKANWKSSGPLGRGRVRSFDKDRMWWGWGFLCVKSCDRSQNVPVHRVPRSLHALLPSNVIHAAYVASMHLGLFLRSTLS